MDVGREGTTGWVEAAAVDEAAKGREGTTRVVIFSARIRGHLWGGCAADEGSTLDAQGGQGSSACKPAVRLNSTAAVAPD